MQDERFYQERCWTVKEAAEEYSVSERTIRRWCILEQWTCYRRGKVWFVLKGQTRPKDPRPGRGT